MTARTALSILDAIDDPHLFARWFRNAETWRAWRAFLAALFGLPMTDDAAAIFRACTGRQTLPTDPAREAWLIIGRRGGKSFTLALIAVFLAAFRDYRPYLAPGERATILVIATDRRQARAIFRYARALLVEVPMLAALVERETADTIDLTGRVSVEVGTASHRTIRGLTVAAALADEIAFWPTDDAAEPDYAILDALRPGMATIPGAMLLCASSPYARRGALYDAWRRWHGRDDAPALVWQADTRAMNPTVPEAVVAAAFERDPASAAAEYGATFRSDVERFLSPELVAGCQRTALLEAPPREGVSYFAFVDPSGGGADEYTLAIGHRAAGDVAVVDLVRGRQGSPAAITADFAALARSYRIRRVYGDRYAADWPRQEWRRHGIEYSDAPGTRSELYLALLAALSSGRAELPPCQRLERQLVALERRTSRAGRDMIDHAPGAHDDRANAVAGLVAILAARPKRTAPVIVGVVQVGAGRHPWGTGGGADGDRAVIGAI